MKQYIKSTPENHWFMGGQIYTAMNALRLVGQLAHERYAKHHPVSKARIRMWEALRHLKHELEEAALREHPDEANLLMYSRGSYPPEIQEDVRQWWTKTQVQRVCGVKPDQLQEWADAGRIAHAGASRGRLYRPQDVGDAMEQEGEKHEGS